MAGYFYKGQRLATKVSADKACTWSVFAGAEFVLGEICEETQLLLAVDRQNSIIKARNSRCYSPYGFDQAALTKSLLGYNGEHRDVTSGCDLLGNGVRAYSPVLMRFCSPDVISPFGAGGINAYAYCEGDPINYLDTDGRMKSTPRPRAIQRESRSSSPISAMSEMVAALPVNGNRPLSRGVHAEGASWQTEPLDLSLPTVPIDRLRQGGAANQVTSSVSTPRFAPEIWKDAKEQFHQYWDNASTIIYKPNKYSDQDYISALSIQLSKDRKVPVPYTSVSDYVRRTIATQNVVSDAGTLRRIADRAMQYNKIMRSNE